MLKKIIALTVILFNISCNDVIQPIYKEKLIYVVPDLFKEFIPPSDSIISNRDKQWIKNNFNQFIRTRKFNGSILIAKNDEIIFDTLIGFTDFRTKKHLADTNAFQLASVSKPITATVILQMVAEGKIKLEDKLTSFFPNLPKVPYKDISVKMLLSHQTGLSQYYYYCDQLVKNKNTFLTHENVLELIKKRNPRNDFKPGAKFSYCNTNYMFLAMIAEKIDSVHFSKIVENRIIKPSKMNNSFVLNIHENSPPSNTVMGNDATNKIIGFDFLDGVVGDKGMFASAKDLYEFDRSLFNCNLIPDSLYQIATQPHTKIDSKKSAYGLGWRLRFNEELGKIVYHTGWWHGNRHIYFKIPSKDYTVIILSNSLKGSTYNLNEMLEIFYHVD
jgi:CubicO group peptidase (beta-lactamase class C family)